jgi:hypothetical protein
MGRLWLWTKRKAQDLEKNDNHETCIPGKARS